MGDRAAVPNAGSKGWSADDMAARYFCNKASKLTGDCETHIFIVFDEQYMQSAYTDRLRLIDAAAVHKAPKNGA